MSVADVLIDTSSPPTSPRRPSGPARGHRAKPGHRQGVLRPHQQHPAACIPSRRSESPRHKHGAHEPDAADARVRQPQRLCPRAQERSRPVAPQLPMEAAPRLWRPDAPETYFAGYPDEGQSDPAAPTTWPSIPKATCGSARMETPWDQHVACSGYRSRPRAWAREAVLDRACGRPAVLSSAGTPGRSSWRSSIRVRPTDHLRVADQHLAAHPRLPAPVGRGRLQTLIEHRPAHDEDPGTNVLVEPETAR